MWWENVAGRPILVTLNAEFLVVCVYGIVECLDLSPNLRFVGRRRADSRYLQSLSWAVVLSRTLTNERREVPYSTQRDYTVFCH